MIGALSRLTLGNLGRAAPRRAAPKPTITRPVLMKAAKAPYPEAARRAHFLTLTNWTLDPRFTATFKLHENVSLSAGVGIFHQEP